MPPHHPSLLRFLLCQSLRFLLSKILQARLYFHQPKFGLIDEGTSAVDDASFDQLYRYAKDNGTTIITIAHQELNHHHTHYLQLNGTDGGWEAGKL